MLRSRVFAMCKRSALCLAVLACVARVVFATGEQENTRPKRTIMYPIYNEPENYYDNNQSDRIQFQEDEGSAGGQRFQGMRAGQRPTTSRPVAGKREIPLDILKRLNDMENISDFFPYLIGGAQTLGTQTLAGSVDIGNRFGDEADERKSVVDAKAAKCMPEDRTVSLLEETNDPSMLYIPSCTRVKRCGGCCSSSIMSCQPVETEIINFRVYVTQYTGDNMFVMRNKTLIPIEQHTKCKCDCIIKPKDCNRFQEYRPGECSCACMNKDERDKCYAASHRKVWDANRCVCACRHTEECTTGQVFNPATCRCMSIPDRMNRRHIGAAAGEAQKRRGEKRRQNNQPRLVEPILPIEVKAEN